MTHPEQESKRNLKVSISEVTTLHCNFEEDVRLYSKHGVTGIGVWGFKMEKYGPTRANELLKEHNLVATNCIPDGNSILPYVLSPEPSDPYKRVEAFLPNMASMAKLNPAAIVVITGPLGNYEHQKAWDLCLDGFTKIGKAASDLGLTIVLEPIHKSGADVFTMIWDIPETLRMLKELNQPSFKLHFDTWHLWDTPGMLDLLKQNIDLVGGVHVSDWSPTPRTWADRYFPGEGVLPMKEIIQTLDDAGWKGYYDVEIFSDDGEYGEDYPDLLWKLSPDEIVERSIRFLKEM